MVLLDLPIEILWNILKQLKFSKSSLLSFFHTVKPFEEITNQYLLIHFIIREKIQEIRVLNVQPLDVFTQPFSYLQYIESNALIQHSDFIATYQKMQNELMEKNIFDISDDCSVALALLYLPFKEKLFSKNRVRISEIAIKYESLAWKILRDDTQLRDIFLSDKNSLEQVHPPQISESSLTYLVKIACAYESLWAFIVADPTYKQKLLHCVYSLTAIALIHVSMARFILEKKDKEISSLFFEDEEGTSQLKKIVKKYPALETIYSQTLLEEDAASFNQEEPLSMRVL